MNIMNIKGSQASEIWLLPTFHRYSRMEVTWPPGETPWRADSNFWLFVCLFVIVFIYLFVFIFGEVCLFIYLFCEKIWSVWGMGKNTNKNVLMKRKDEGTEVITNWIQKRRWRLAGFLICSFLDCLKVKFHFIVQLVNIGFPARTFALIRMRITFLIPKGNLSVWHNSCPICMRI